MRCRRVLFPNPFPTQQIEAFADLGWLAGLWGARFVARANRPGPRGPDRLLVRWLGGVVIRSDIRALKPRFPGGANGGANGIRTPVSTCGKCYLTCRFTPSRSGSVPLIACGFVFGS